jgi:oligopeptide/dipeptide ABC transporter ATP-binding protein
VILAGRILEEGPTDLLLEHALHPYTRRLLSGLRPAGPTSAQVSSDHGCPWASRCDLVRPTCHDQVPALVNVTSGHRSRCPVTCNGESTS